MNKTIDKKYKGSIPVVSEVDASLFVVNSAVELWLTLDSVVVKLFLATPVVVLGASKETASVSVNKILICCLYLYSLFMFFVFSH